MNQEINFEDFQFEELEQIEEIITPGAGLTLCCTT